MWQGIWRKYKDEISIWRVGALPGFIVIAVIIIARLTGSLQFLEWITLDTFLRFRPSETIDKRIVIVGINEADIQSVGKYPIPDREIAALIKKLQKYKPRAIGLDLVRYIPVEPGHNELGEVFKESKNIYGIEKILLPNLFYPPPELPHKQISFSDVIPDKDGKYRRMILGIPTDEEYKHSFCLRLAEAFLSHEGITLENGIRDTAAMRFGSTELPRFLPNTGGYVGTDAGGVQILLNFRSGAERFRTLSLNDIKTGNFNPQWIGDRIVMIGMTTSSTPDFIDTSATVPGLIHDGQVYGVEFNAHGVSQIISAVLDGRSLINTWPHNWEYLWIFCWGFFGISLGRFTQSAWKNFVAVGVASVCLIAIGYYVLLLWGLWIPVAPILLILAINGVGLSAFAFYQYDQGLKSQIVVRQRAMEMAFTEIHNGPLQTLATLLRGVQNQELSNDELHLRLQTLNVEIREIGEFLTQITLKKEEVLRLGSGLKIDLNHPIHQLLYEVYSSTTERKIPYFQTLKVKVRSFEPIEEQNLSFEEKRELCQFLEEALCNVGKHAKGVTRLYATGTKKDGWYTLRIKDNGPGICSSYENKGTKQSKDLAQQLGGFFKRETLSSQGTLCELTWPMFQKKSLLRKIKHRLKNFFQKK
ncbi:MAG: CHASE2 domain-containing protein [Stigonema ocellatum SAG 48.90 = DSM 106950]|nr:CHASE2 domain-containing protein [Stigonema ocellatum SAG 48.90 = DSM 106950]